VKEERKRLDRLRRLEKIRDIAKQTAALESAQAESTLTQLRALSDRTRQMATDYASRREMNDGASLHQVGRFVSGLQALTRTTEGDTLRAQSIADAKQRQLAEAERSRAAIEERAVLQERMIAKAAHSPALSGRKGSGTDLD
jgi:hypothetical protein